VLQIPAFDSLDRAVFKSITVPLLITFGAKDAIFLQSAASYAKELVPSAQLSVYLNSGHSTFWEQAKRFNSELADFVG